MDVWAELRLFGRPTVWTWPHWQAALFTGVRQRRWATYPARSSTSTAAMFSALAFCTGTSAVHSIAFTPCFLRPVFRCPPTQAPFFPFAVFHLIVAIPSPASHQCGCGRPGVGRGGGGAASRLLAAFHRRWQRGGLIWGGLVGCASMATIRTGVNPSSHWVQTCLEYQGFGCSSGVRCLSTVNT